MMDLSESLFLVLHSTERREVLYLMEYRSCEGHSEAHKSVPVGCAGENLGLKKLLVRICKN